MRWILGWIIASAALAAHADTATLRVGSQVLVAGDSAARVVEVLGKPLHKARGKATARPSKSSGGKGRKVAPKQEATGEHWQYRVEGRLITIVVAEGRVAEFRDAGR